jgi:hypothetical protein
MEPCSCEQAIELRVELAAVDEQLRHQVAANIEQRGTIKRVRFIIELIRRGEKFDIAASLEKALQES